MRDWRVADWGDDALEEAREPGLEAFYARSLGSSFGGTASQYAGLMLEG